MDYKNPNHLKALHEAIGQLNDVLDSVDAKHLSGDAESKGDAPGIGIKPPDAKQPFEGEDDAAVLDDDADLSADNSDGVADDTEPEENSGNTDGDVNDIGKDDNESGAQDLTDDELPAGLKELMGPPKKKFGAR